MSMNLGWLHTRLPMPAWTPLVDPLYQRVAHISDYWMWLLIPLVLVISVVYQTARKAELRQVPIAALWMSVKILAAFAVIGIGLELLYHYLTVWSVTGHP